MSIFFHELKQNKISLIVWTSIISFMIMVCVLIYPEMSSEMEEMSEMFSNMGTFSQAFGMDTLNFGEFMGYFGIECGNTLGLGGAFFAAIIGISSLSKEEKNKTADFLLTHPVPRKKIVLENILKRYCIIKSLYQISLTLLSQLYLIQTFFRHFDFNSRKLP